MNLQQLKENIKKPLLGFTQEQWDNMSEELKIEILMLIQMDGETIEQELLYIYGEKSVDYYRELTNG